MGGGGLGGVDGGEVGGRWWWDGWCAGKGWGGWWWGGWMMVCWVGVLVRGEVGDGLFGGW